MADDRDSSPSCPVCGHAQDVSWLLEKDGWRLFRCRACDHIFVSPQPTPAELKRIYSFESGYHVGQKGCLEQGPGADPRLVDTLAHIRQYVAAGSLLDVGCATGRFMALARAAGFAVRGVELNPDTAAIAHRRGLDVVVGAIEDVNLDPRSFDVVYMGDVIEHVRDPAALLRRVHGLLRPDGLVALVTPVHDAFFPRTTFMLFRALGVPWSHPTPPHHLHQFSTLSLTALLGQTGFDICDRQYGPCSLSYEIHGTGVLSVARRLVRERRLIAAGAQAVLCLGVGLLYGLVWVADRCRPYKPTDFELLATARVRRDEVPRPPDAS